MKQEHKVAGGEMDVKHTRTDEDGIIKLGDEYANRRCVIIIDVGCILHTEG